MRYKKQANSGDKMELKNTQIIQKKAERDGTNKTATRWWILIQPY